MEEVRIDKWLWAARFFKTRSIAAQAAAGGHVHLNGNRVKPSKAVHVGDMLRIQRGETEFVVLVQGVSDKRRPAVEAKTLYEETLASIAAREEQQEKDRLAAADRMYGPMKRPNKRERRQIRDFTRKLG